MVFSLSRSTSSKDLRRQYAQDSSSQHPMPPLKSSTKFSLASALGLKSKKSPSLAIEPPPVPISSNVVPISDTPRPISKSASSTRSRVDSLEPRTPIDSNRDTRHSLLTLADDPFAGRPMIAVPMPHPPSDPSRLSAYSNPSVTDLVQKKGVEQPSHNRISYASSSSNSNHHAFDIPPMTPPLPSSSKVKTEFRELHKKRSIGSIQFQRTEVPLHRQTTLIIPSTNPRGQPNPSLAMGHDFHSIQAVDGPDRPKLRARGMTDSSASQQAGFFVEERRTLRKMPQKSPTSSNPPPSPETSVQGRSKSPRVVIRQSSITHFQTPPSAPPTQGLPPPPPSQQPVQDSYQRRSRPSSSRHVKSPSSSSISFSSPISLTNDMFANPPFIHADDDKRRSGRSLFSQIAYDELEFSMFERDHGTVSSSPRTLKKPLSQQSLSRRAQTSAPPGPKIPEDVPPEKTFRKQRSFQHPRLPVPPFPFPPSAPASSIPSPMISPSSGETAQGSSLERRRTSSSGRRRLFSYSSQNRPSTAQPLSSTTRDEDAFSLLSFRSEAGSHVLPYQPWLPPAHRSASSTSFWDENGHDQPASPVRSTIEYTPQSIMSRAALAELEASVDTASIRITRSRGFSVMSASTMASEAEKDSEVISIALSPPPAPSRPSSKQRPARLSISSSKMSPAPISRRPQSSPQSVLSGQGDIRSQSISAAAWNGKPAHEAISLPPPPRKQRPPTVISEPQIPDKPRGRSFTQKSGPVRKSTTGKVMNRRSIMRKSSFLDIEDETDSDTDQDIQRTTGSFLDLARESFDTTRSDF